MNRITKYSGGVAVIPKEKIKDAARQLAKYEDTGLTPEEIMDGKMLTGWIPVEERLPEDGTYLCTMEGELCGLEEPFTGMCGFYKGKWDEGDCVIAWMPLPKSYQQNCNKCPYKYKTQHTYRNGMVDEITMCRLYNKQLYYYGNNIPKPDYKHSCLNKIN